MTDSNCKIPRPDIAFAHIPFQWVGPVLLRGDIDNELIDIPLSTYEKPLWPSVNRGARVTQQAGGIQVTLLHECMTRSILLSAKDGADAHRKTQGILAEMSALQNAISEKSRFAQLQSIHPKIIGNLIYLRLEFTTGDASGHNMSTLAAECVIDYLLRHYPDLEYRAISGNFCTDKKVSAVNSILGRGKSVIAEVTIPSKLVQRYLKTTPEALVRLNYEKNLLGSIAAGGLVTANAHAANMLLGVYLATGQDAANIVEGSQVINHCELRDGDLYFSCSCPSVIVGTVGNGKDLPIVQQVLTHIGCAESRSVGDNSRRLALLVAATVLCGELSLLAAISNQGELMYSHIKYERR